MMSMLTILNRVHTHTLAQPIPSTMSSVQQATDKKQKEDAGGCCFLFSFFVGTFFRAAQPWNTARTVA